MSTTTQWIISASGVVPIALALRDVFHTLFHPQGEGSITRVVMSTTWRLFRKAGRIRKGALRLAGPVGIVLVIATWATLLLFGWALVYWPHVPGAFVFAPGLEPSPEAGFGTALYLSLVALGTLGYGDIVPTETWLRVVAPLESLVGLMLLSASVAWVLSIYPAVRRQRALANRIFLLRQVDRGQAGRVRLDAANVDSLLQSLAADVVGIRVDLRQRTGLYYFHSLEPHSSLPALMPYLADLTSRNLHRRSPNLGAVLLAQAVEDLAGTLAGSLHLDDASTEDVLAAYAADHLESDD